MPEDFLVAKIGLVSPSDRVMAVVRKHRQRQPSEEAIDVGGDDGGGVLEATGDEERGAGIGHPRRFSGCNQLWVLPALPRS